jgi:hypothetical protein
MEPGSPGNARAGHETLRNERANFFNRVHSGRVSQRNVIANPEYHIRCDARTIGRARANADEQIGRRMVDALGLEPRTR